MVGILLRKLWRDMRRQRAQFLAVSLTIFLGVLLFVASYSAYQNLKESYAETFTRLGFPDLWAIGGDVGAFREGAAGRPYVDTVEVRWAGDVALRVSGETVLRGQAISLPVGEEPELARVLVDEGESLSAGADGLLAERHFADHFQLAPGDDVEVLTAEGWQKVQIAGIAVSAEYLWPARSRQDVLAPPDDFGVVFVPESMAQRLDLPQQALVSLVPGSEAAALDELKALAADSGATDVYGRDGQPSNAALQEDVSAFRELSWMFPAMFLTAAGVATYILLSRLIQSQRSNIGMFLANGMPARLILLHYVGYGLAPSLLAGVTGAVAGIFLGMAISGLYTESLSIPLTVTRVRFGTPLVGIGVGVVAGIVATSLPALRASRLHPAETMSAAPATAAGGRSLLESMLPPLKLLPLRAKLVLRNITRARGRSFSITIGVIIALTLIIVSWGMLDSTRFIVSRHFDDINRDDARVFFDHPVSSEDLAALEAVGVARAEPMAIVRTGIRSDGGFYGTELLGFRSGTALHRFYRTESSEGGLPAEGILLGRAARGLLDVERGDTVELLLPGASSSVEAVIAGFVDEPLGTSAFVSLDELSRLAGGAGVDYGSLVTAAGLQFAPGADRAEMRTLVSALPGVAAYSDSQALKEAVNSLMEFFYVIVGMMLTFGVALAAALIFNSISVTVAERTTEFASLIASGMQYRTVAFLLAAETLAVTAIALPPGLVVAWLAGREFMASFDSDLFHFAWHPEPPTMVLSALGIVAASALSQIPGLWSIRRLDLAVVIRERTD